MKVVFIGSGSIATSLGHVIASSQKHEVQLLSIEAAVVQNINKHHLNPKYFPSIPLSNNLSATIDKKTLFDADIIFLAIPANEIESYIIQNLDLFSKHSIIVNLAKGFTINNEIICHFLSEKMDNPICSFKGPSFARELINHIPTAFTLGTNQTESIAKIRNIFSNTSIVFDHSTDITGVEVLSILKNIYSISMGLIDANFNAANLRFMFLTKALNEIKTILLNFHGNQDTLFRYCGFGDFGLTALNDLSRNRTLGLLLGKGFFTSEISHKVTLEGKIATTVTSMKMKKANLSKELPILTGLDSIFRDECSIENYIKSVI